jgi:hypothetical protein
MTASDISLGKALLGSGLRSCLQKEVLIPVLPSQGEVHFKEASEVNRIKKETTMRFLQKLIVSASRLLPLLPKLSRRSSGVEERGGDGASKYAIQLT